MGARTYDKLRQHPRASLKTLVKEKNSHAFPYYMSKNVSEGGMFLLSKSPYPVGTKIHLEFVIPDQRFSVIVEGEIVSRVPFDPGKGNETSCGMGIKFINPPEEIRTVLRDFVTKHKGPPPSPLPPKVGRGYR